MECITKPVIIEGGRSSPISLDVATRVNTLASLDSAQLRAEWRRLYRSHPPKGLSRDLLIRAIAYKLQERAVGGLGKATLRRLKSVTRKLKAEGKLVSDRRLSLKSGARLVREWGGETHSVLVLEDGFEYRGQRYRSLSQMALLITGAHWSGPRFFGIERTPKPRPPSSWLRPICGWPGLRSRRCAVRCVRPLPRRRKAEAT